MCIHVHQNRHLSVQWTVCLLMCHLGSCMVTVMVVLHHLCSTMLMAVQGDTGVWYLCIYVSLHT